MRGEKDIADNFSARKASSSSEIDCSSLICMISTLGIELTKKRATVIFSLLSILLRIPKYGAMGVWDIFNSSCIVLLPPIWFESCAKIRRKTRTAKRFGIFSPFIFPFLSVSASAVAAVVAVVPGRAILVVMVVSGSGMMAGRGSRCLMMTRPSAVEDVLLVYRDTVSALAEETAAAVAPYHTAAVAVVLLMYSGSAVIDDMPVVSGPYLQRLSIGGGGKRQQRNDN